MTDTDFLSNLAQQRSTHSEPEESVKFDSSSSMEELVAAAVTGNRSAGERLLKEIYPGVLRYCRARLGRQIVAVGSADDIAQDVCHAIISALPTYTIKGLSFRAFVYGIAVHKVTDAFRAAGRNRVATTSDLSYYDAALLDGPEVLALEELEKTRELFNLLPSRQREVLLLRIAVGLSAEETAVIVGSTPGAVRVTQHRALAQLRTKLAESPELLSNDDEHPTDPLIVPDEGTRTGSYFLDGLLDTGDRRLWTLVVESARIAGNWFPTTVLDDPEPTPEVPDREVTYGTGDPSIDDLLNRGHSHLRKKLRGDS